MGILIWIAFGLIVATFAQVVIPGKNGGGIVVMAFVVAAGVVAGGTITTQLGSWSMSVADVRTMLTAVGGSLLLLIGYRMSWKLAT